MPPRNAKAKAKRPVAKDSVIIAASELQALMARVQVDSAAETAPRQPVKSTNLRSTQVPVPTIATSATSLSGPVSPHKREVAERGRARKDRMQQIDLERKRVEDAGSPAGSMSRRDDVGRHEMFGRQGGKARQATGEAGGVHAGEEALRASSVELLGSQSEALAELEKMNQMVTYARCVTIRDAQILEKNALKNKEKEEEQQLFSTMEKARTQGMEEQKTRDERRRRERLEGAHVIQKQMELRSEERMRQQELREQEAQGIVQREKDLQLKEEQERKEKIARARQLQHTIMLSNAEQSRHKIESKREEAEEDMRIAEYIRQRDVREAANETELKRVRQEKEREIARLRTLQEKQQDRQAALDELRAKRYQEEKDRQWRAAQLAAAQKRKAKALELNQSRVVQRSERERRLAEEARLEREEFQNMIQESEREADVERKRESIRQASKLETRQEIITQIRAHERAKQQQRRENVEDADRRIRKLASEAERMEAVKQHKLDQLARSGVPEKYRSELRRKKVLGGAAANAPPQKA